VAVAAEYHAARQRAHIDDPAGALFTHDRGDRQQHTDTAEIVGLEELPDFLQRSFLHRTATADAGVVDQGIDTTCVGHDAGYGLVDRVAVGDVQLNDADWQTARGNFFLQFRGSVGVAHPGVNLMTLAGQVQGGSLADASACAGDEYGGHSDSLCFSYR
jgi:hypothetical protein